MKYILYFTKGLLLLLFIGACKKNEIPPENTPLIIHSFYPNSGKSSTLVTFKGKGFNKVYEQNKVTFGTLQAEVISVTDSSMVALAPADGNTGLIAVSNGVATAEAGTFTYQNLSLTSVLPLRAAAFEILNIKGYGFKGDADMPVVTINDLPAKITYLSDSLLLVAVPATGTGKGGLKVTVGDKVVTGPEISLVKVLDYAPRVGFGGTEITVTGTGFNPSINGNKVFYKTSASVWVWDGPIRTRQTVYYTDTLQIVDATESKIVALMPETVNVFSGAIEIVSDGIPTALQPEDKTEFKVLQEPTISMLFPEKPVAGSFLYIIGSNFLTHLNGFSTQLFIGSYEVPSDLYVNGDGNLFFSSFPADIPSGVIKVIANGKTVTGPYLDLD